MVERFNGRIADVLKTHRFNSREDMQQTLLRYVVLCNYQLPQSALKSSTPMQALKQWHQERLGQRDAECERLERFFESIGRPL